MAEPVMNWRGQVGPLKIFKGSRRKTGERKRGMEKRKKGGMEGRRDKGRPDRPHPADWVCKSETLSLT